MKSGKTLAWMIGLSVLLLLSIAAGAGWGSLAELNPLRAWQVLIASLSGGDVAETDAYILFQVRLPRAITAALVGCGLAVAGCCMQGLFNNPLASPGVLGVSSGGAFGAVAAIFLGLGGFGVPLGAFVGALAAAIGVFVIATRQGRTPMATLLLAGMAFNAILGAGVSLLLTLKMDNFEATQRIVYWLIGGLEARSWSHVRMAAPPILIGSALAVFLARDLNGLALGEETAASLGIHVQRMKIESLALVSIVAAAAVSVSGVLVFVGLVVPHMLRLLVGPDHRRLIPACALGGGAFLVLMDLAARLAVRPQEIRVGILTSLIGGPFFIALLIVNRRRMESV